MTALSKGLFVIGLFKFEGVDVPFRKKERISDGCVHPREKKKEGAGPSFLVGCIWDDW